MRVTTWVRVAEVLGVSVDTVARTRARVEDQTRRPWFRDEDECIAWWKEMLVRASGGAKRRKATAKREREKAIDLRELGRAELGV